MAGEVTGLGGVVRAGDEEGGAGKTVPGSFQQKGGKRSLDGTVLERRTWAWPVFGNIQQ